MVAVRPTFVTCTEGAAGFVTETTHAECESGRRQSFEHEMPSAVGSRDPHGRVPLHDRYVGTADHVPIGRRHRPDEPINGLRRRGRGK